MAVTASFQRVSVLVTSMSTWSPGWRFFSGRPSQRKGSMPQFTTLER